MRDPVRVGRFGPALVTYIKGGNGYESYFITRADVCRKVPSYPWESCGDVTANLDLWGFCGRISRRRL
jgi:hypothetical protein